MQVYHLTIQENGHSRRFVYEDRDEALTRFADAIAAGLDAKLDEVERAPALPKPAERSPDEIVPPVSIEKKPGESLAPTDRRLVSDLGSQAGLVRRNVALNAGAQEEEWIGADPAHRWRFDPATSSWRIRTVCRCGWTGRWRLDSSVFDRPSSGASLTRLPKPNRGALRAENDHRRHCGLSINAKHSRAFASLSRACAAARRLLAP